MNIPRVMIAAPKSGSGKTLLTSALLTALKLNNKKPAAFKCGPDYIDPMFHRTAIGVPSENLDTYFSSGGEVRDLMAEMSADSDIAVIEGVMGLYDGLGAVRAEGSSYHLASVTKTPIILVVDAKGMGRSVSALIKGFKESDEKGLLRGVILNRTTEAMCKVLRPIIEKECGVCVAGYMPEMKDVRIESRHLGLKLPHETDDIRSQLKKAAQKLVKTCDLDEILKIADGADELETDNTKKPETLENVLNKSNLPTLAVARDEAFCFYYEANLRCFTDLGIHLKFFSPLHDKALPSGADAVLLGGGYPEVYAEELSENASMRNSIKDAINAGMPSIAECGGFMYLHESIRTDEAEYPMSGVIPGTVFNTGKLVRFGYVQIREKTPTFLKNGGVIKGHEFHYFDSTNNGSDCVAEKIVSGKSWDCVHAGENHFWGFAHLYYPSAPEFVVNFCMMLK